MIVPRVRGTIARGLDAMRSPTRGDAERPIGDIPRVDDETIPVRRRQLLTLIQGPSDDGRPARR